MKQKENLVIGVTLVKCPRCNTEVATSVKEWNYAKFQAQNFYCPSCGVGFVAYFCKGKLSHTIPRRKT
ncbi:MAG TPA: hypothetical protein VI864_03515 [Candidatus Bathyarchaeia archaeon]|nr:hypothetical protein [Candidatus Bathyarchaeia archaeon]